MGQTDRGFLVRYNEHKQAFRNNSHTSKFAQHLVEQAHTFSTIHNMIQTANNHLNDNQNIFPNPVFDAILKTHQQ